MKLQRKLPGDQVSKKSEILKKMSNLFLKSCTLIGMSFEDFKSQPHITSYPTEARMGPHSLFSVCGRVLCIF